MQKVKGKNINNFLNCITIARHVALSIYQKPKSTKIIKQFEINNKLKKNLLKLLIIEY